MKIVSVQALFLTLSNLVQRRKYSCKKSLFGSDQFKGKVLAIRFEPKFDIK